MTPEEMTRYGVLELTKADFHALVRALSAPSTEGMFGLTTERRKHLMAAFHYMAEITDDHTFPYLLVAKDSWLLTKTLAEGR